MAETFARIGASLQLYEIGHHQIEPTLFDVWALTALTHQLLFPNNKWHKATPAC